MRKPPLFETYQNIGHTNKPEGSAGDLKKFVETFVTSLSNLVRAFPNSNLDIKTLEAHYWDRLRYFYYFESFKDVKIETKEELAFINEAIKQIAEWFYQGQWTNCLTTPSDEEIKALFSGDTNTFLKRVREVKNKRQYPNLGRDGKTRSSQPLPNIYEDAKSGADLRQVYSAHAFKFFQNPAAVINTLTKLSVINPETINAGAKSRVGKLASMVSSASDYAENKFRQWGYSTARQHQADPKVHTFRRSANFCKHPPEQFDPYTTELYFFKSCMIAAEFMRRRGGNLTKEGFEELLNWIETQKQKQLEAGRNPYNPFFNFAPEGAEENNYQWASQIHAGPRELPTTLMVVAYMNEQRLKKIKPPK